MKDGGRWETYNEKDFEYELFESVEDKLAANVGGTPGAGGQKRKFGC